MFLKNFISRNKTKSTHKIRRIRFLMGTFFEIEIIDTDEDKSRRVIELAFSEIKRTENLLSKYLEKSEISCLNRGAANYPVEVIPEVFNLVELSVRLSNLTQGSFEISIGPLIELWQKGEQNDNVPSDEEIKNILQFVGSKNIVLNPDKKTIFFKKKGVKIDLGGIGKGYAINRVVYILKENEIAQAMINAGGQYYVLGNYFEQEFSPIGIQNPSNPEEIISVVKIKDQSIATSANYERFFTISGKIYGHILNPLTGYPSTELCSVSVISSDPILADVWSTALFVMGLKRANQMIKRNPGMSILSFA
ncbi:MAG: FAD:protein FMN transferase [Nitrospirae bacterium]|nr:FAD:protein FMN transferase [Nitrospirota bacterium]